MKDDLKAKYLLDKEGTMAQWYKDGTLNRNMVAVGDCGSIYMPKNNTITKYELDESKQYVKLNILALSILGYENETGVVFKKDLLNACNWKTIRTLKKHLNTLCKNGFKIIQETEECYIFDYYDWWIKRL